MWFGLVLAAANLGIGWWYLGAGDGLAAGVSVIAGGLCLLGVLVRWWQSQ